MLERKSIPGQATGEGERLMCAALLNAKAGLGADKLRAEQFTLARPSAELSVAEKNQMPRNATVIENSAGYSYGKMAFS